MEQLTTKMEISQPLYFQKELRMAMEIIFTIIQLNLLELMRIILKLDNAQSIILMEMFMKGI